MRALNVFRQIDPEMPIQYVVSFLEIARHEGLSVSDLASRMGMAQSSASRQLAALSKFRARLQPGHDLVAAHEDPMERRKKIIMLTPKGKVLLMQINDLMEE